jgi:hypothetical protein
MSVSDEEFNKKLVESIDLKYFSTPSEREDKDIYFPEYLKLRLSEWLNHYDKNIRQLIDDPANWDTGKSDIVFNRLKNLINGINAAIDNYYAGKVYEASKIFNEAIVENIFQYDKIPSMLTMGANHSFYRARKKEPLKHYKRSDLFHVPFEKRHSITTKRYSIPGLPTLYFGESTYVCWEELEQSDINELWFSRFQNQKNVNVIELLRYEDFKKNVYDKLTFDHATKNGFLFRYIVNFPLNIACTIKVKEKDGAFKPEYIIPQLLLQYVSTNHNIDGIKYPSTKVEYNRLTEVPAYNFVFPVKSVKREGYCDELMNTFYLTQPTSLEWELLKYNPRHQQAYMFSGGPDTSKERMEFIDGEKSPYHSTSFGRIEQHLQTLDKKIERLI